MEMNDQLTNVRKMAIARENSRGRILTITSGKGGVGKTNIALNLSLSLTQMGYSVMLFDADTRLANVDVLLGKTSRYTLADVVFGNKNILDIMLRDVSGLNVISAQSGSEDLSDLEKGIQEHYFREIYNLCYTHDFIVIDTSAGLSEFMIDFVLRADEVIVVTTPEPTSVSDSYALVKLLHGMESGLNIKTLVNFVKSKEEAEELYERFSLVTEHFLNMNTDFLGFLVEDKHVRFAVQKQDPFLRLYPTSKAARCIHEIAGRLV